MVFVLFWDNGVSLPFGIRFVIVIRSIHIFFSEYQNVFRILDFWYDIQ